MTIKQIREFIEKSNFFPKSIDKLVSILDNASQSNSLTQGDKDKMIEIINLEVEVARVKTDMFEKVASSIQNFIKDTDQNLSTAE